MDTITLLVSPHFGQQIGQITSDEIATFKLPPVPPELAETTPLLDVSNQRIIQCLRILLGHISDKCKVLRQERQEEATRFETALCLEPEAEAHRIFRKQNAAKMSQLRAEFETIEDLLSGSIRAQLDPIKTVKLEGVVVLEGWKVYPAPPRPQFQLIGILAPEQEFSEKLFEEIFGTSQ